MEGEFICGVEGEGEEEGEQWSLDELPRHIKKCIFANLPFRSICRSRLVCREWNSILSSRSFVSSLPENNPWLLLCAEEYCMAFCFSTQKWMTISLSFLPTPLGENSSVSAEIDIDETWEVIKIVQEGSGDEPYLVATSESSNDDYYFSIRVYHHFQNSWRIKSEFAEKEGFAIDPSAIVSYCNGVIFFREDPPMTIAGYNIKGASIKPVRIAALPDHILEDANWTSLTFLTYGLSVLLVVLYKDPLIGLIIFELFEDDKDELVWKWREFAKMTPTSLPRYFETSYGEECLVGDYVCYIRSNGKFLEGVAYNLKEGFWECLPECAHITSYYRILSFQPKLMVKGWH